MQYLTVVKLKELLIETHISGQHIAGEGASRSDAIRIVECVMEKMEIHQDHNSIVIKKEE